MTPLDTDAGRAVVDAMADVYARWRQGIETEEIPPHLLGPYEASGQNAREFMPMALLAALAVRKPCPECDGDGLDGSHEAARYYADRGELAPCPSCAGSGFGVPALVELLMRPIVLSGGNYPDEGGPTVYVVRGPLSGAAQKENR